MTATQRDGIKQMQNGDPIWERIRSETREAAATPSPFWRAFCTPPSSIMTSWSVRSAFIWPTYSITLRRPP
jgi:hypothetical protein